MKKCPGPCNDHFFLVLVIDPVFCANGRKLTQMAKHPQNVHTNPTNYRKKPAQIRKIKTKRPKRPWRSRVPYYTLCNSGQPKLREKSVLFPCAYQNLYTVVLLYSFHGTILGPHVLPVAIPKRSAKILKDIGCRIAPSHSIWSLEQLFPAWTKTSNWSTKCNFGLPKGTSEPQLKSH